MNHYDPTPREEKVINILERIAAEHYDKRFDKGGMANGGYHDGYWNGLEAALQLIRRRPTYNHDRGDSELCPCLLCALTTV